MKYFFSLLFSMAILNVFSANSLWQNVSSKNPQIEGERKIIPQVTSVVKLDDATFRILQQTIPTEQSGRYVILSLPLPDGSVSDFRVFERTCMEQGLADKYPMIKTYQAINVDNPTVIAKLDYTPFGFHAMVFSNEGIYFIDPVTNVNTGYYNCYYKKDYQRQSNDFSVCATKTPTDNININNPSSYRLAVNNPGATDIVSDGKIRKFRLALACTIEYAAAVGGPTPTKATVLAAMVTSMNRVNGVYEKELSIHMNLVANDDTLIFITSDSYTNNNGGSMLGQNQTVCDARIGSANYDIGHVFSTGGGGVAGLGVVCINGQKANGVTGSSNPVGDGFDIDYVAHEMGHQFGGNHTFNGNTGSCSGNRNASTAYEVGSGTTIMAYAGICTGNDPQQHSDDYFHRVSLKEIFSYISGTSCAVLTNTGTAVPTVSSYARTYYIPYKTDFEFTATATDPAGHPLTYCWEEYDLGPAGSWNATNNTTAPIFRSFLPKTSGTRVFPIWDSLIKNNIKYLGEVLPETTRDVKFRCTVRGLDPNGWGIYSAPDSDLTIKSVTTTTLFRVTSQATATTITGNTSQTVTWDVAGTTASPISSANVDIYLSLDSARTFPYLLASATANDGSETVTIPDVNTNNKFSARIKVKGNGNVFFDLNDGWIKINQAAPVLAASFTANNNSVCQGASVTFTNTSTGSPDSVRWTINGGTPSTSNSLTTIASTFNTAGSFIISLTAYKAGVASAPFTSSVVVNAKSTSSVIQTICEGQSVTVGGQTFTTTQVNKVIVLANANSRGCDSTITLNLTVNPKSTSSVTQTICEGQSVTVGGQTFTTTQVNKVIVLANANSRGCDSTITLNLTVNPKSTSSVTQTICEGQSVTVGGQTFTTSQVNKVIVLANANSKGCDSTITLNLTVNPKSASSITQTICEGQSVTVGGQIFTTTQVNRVIVLANANSKGCDSTITLNLTVNPRKITNISRVICEGESVIVGSDVFTATGNYITHLQTSLSCDSTVNLNLTVNPKSTSSVTQTICEGQSVTAGGQTFTTSQVNKIIVLANANSRGCDSTITLNLTVNPKSTSSVTQTICEGQSVTVGGQTFTTAQVNKVIVLANANSKGCDSTITLNLSVKPKPTIVFTPAKPVTCAGTPIDITAQYIAGATCIWSTGSSSQTITVTPLSDKYYSVTVTNDGCASTDSVLVKVNPIKTTNLSRTICQGESVTVGSDVFTATGNYIIHLQTSLSCDSAVVLNLTVNPKSTSSVTQTICEGQSVTVGGQTFTTSQVNKVIVLANANSKGCDSTITLNLTVNPKKTTNISRTICNGDSVTVGTTVYKTQGTFTTHLQTSLTCDSAVILNLTVKPTKTINISRTICEEDTLWVGTEAFTESGNYTVHLQTSLGCDSTVNLALTVIPTKIVTFSQAICNGDSVVIGGQAFYTLGLHTVVLQSSTGCDSIVVVDIGIGYPARTVLILRNDTLIIPGNGFGTYDWYLNGVFQVSTTEPFHVPTQSGSWTVKEVSVCIIPMSLPVTVTVVTGIKTNKNDIVFSIVPNPNNGQFELKITADKADNYQLLLYNVTGQEIRKEEMNIQRGVNVKQFNLDNIEKGMYFISLIGNDGVATQNIIVQ